MPEQASQQEKVHGLVPKQVKDRFLATFPWSGAQQWAIRLAFEVLPEIVDRDAAFAEIFLNEMRMMYENDRANWVPKPMTVDRRQLDIPLPSQLSDENTASYIDDDTYDPDTTTGTPG
jgi:hypothetical protein